MRGDDGKCHRLQPRCLRDASLQRGRLADGCRCCRRANVWLLTVAGTRRAWARATLYEQLDGTTLWCRPSPSTRGARSIDIANAVDAWLVEEEARLARVRREPGRAGALTPIGVVAAKVGDVVAALNSFVSITSSSLPRRRPSSRSPWSC